ncbi:MAG: hypothetical protein HY900_04680 [Deltaproteobacteria bacterium]|nr:hypothetical protein [Deltaproteobacteria bacterium]
MKGKQPGRRAAALVVLFAFSGVARPGVNAHAGGPVAPAPAAAIAPAVPAPESVVLIPHTSIYFVPEVGLDLFFTRGYWWTCHEGRWLRARSHSGPWSPVARRSVPGPLLRLPRHYKTVYVHGERIPYGQWKAHRGEWSRAGEGQGRAHRKEARGHGKGDD